MDTYSDMDTIDCIEVGYLGIAGCLWVYFVLANLCKIHISIMDYSVISIGKDTIIIKNNANGELCEVVKSQEILEMCNQEREVELVHHDEDVDVSCATTSTFKKATWTDVATHMLIELYKLNETKFKSTNFRNEAVWKIISAEMNNKGFSFNQKQCEFKWKHLKKLYMKIIDNMGSKGSGEAPEHFKYYDEMDAIFSDRPNVKPVAVASSSKGGSVSRENWEEEEPKAKKQKRNNMSELLRFLEEKEKKKEEARTKRHQEKLSLQREFLDQLKSITAPSKINYPGEDHKY